MHVIRTAEDMARALDSPLDPELYSILAGHADRLSAYPGFRLEDLAIIIILQTGDRLVDAGLDLVGAGGGRFSPEPEFVLRHAGVIEAVFVISDDGQGIVLLVQQGEGADPELIAACEAELA